MANMQLISGYFNKSDALHLITEMTKVKIRFHENKIGKSENEEDIKMREARIKQLQNDLADCRKILLETNASVSLNAQIDIA